MKNLPRLLIREFRRDAQQVDCTEEATRPLKSTRLEVRAVNYCCAHLGLHEVGCACASQGSFPWLSFCLQHRHDLSALASCPTSCRRARVGSRHERMASVTCYIPASLAHISRPILGVGHPGSDQGGGLHLPHEVHHHGGLDRCWMSKYSIRICCLRAENRVQVG